MESRELEHLTAAVKAGGAAKYHTANARRGKMFARDRIERLVDPGSFVEDGLFANVLADGLPADAVVTLRVLRGRAPDLQELDMRLRPLERPRTEATSELVPLDDVAEADPRTGLLLATLPAPLSDVVYGLDAPQPLVAEVVVGSPAWEAGLRRGMFVTHVERTATLTPKQFHAAAARHSGETQLRTSDDEDPLRTVAPESS